MSPNSSKPTAVLLALALVAVFGVSPVVSTPVNLASEANNAFEGPAGNSGQFAQQGTETGAGNETETEEANVTEVNIEDHQDSPTGVEVMEIRTPATIDSGEGFQAEIEVANPAGEEEVAVVSMEIRNADTNRVHYAQSQVFYLAEGGESTEDYTVSNATLPPGEYNVVFDTVKAGDTDVRSLNVTSE